MLTTTTLIVSLSLFSAVLIGVLIIRPGITSTTGGKILAFLVLFFLPVLCGAMGLSSEMDRSKTTAFCLSCHTMEPFGKSLHVDDSGHLPAAHFQNHRVPSNEACYTCHADYAMFGTLKVKLRGLRHVYVYYFGVQPAPENIKLYEPFDNRECLHCHLGARSFEEGAVHTADPATLPAVKSNSLSCMSGGCHDVVHDIAGLKGAKLWKDPSDAELKPVQ
ncbi:MAG TPA: NapC/NirT family cytochrome c [Candidatus Acidoferrum sp.]|jgi:cytochrome c-type protein NapC